MRSLKSIIMPRKGAALVLAATLPLMALAASTPAVAFSRQHHAAAAVSTRHGSALLNSAVFTLGTDGGFIRTHLRVTIFANGTVLVKDAFVTSDAHPHLTKDVIDGLLRLAQAEGFFSLPSLIQGRMIPDVGGRYITVTTTSGTKTVEVRYTHKAAFDQLYAVLLSVAGQWPSM